MVINTNIMALNAYRHLGNAYKMQAKASARLSSGSRINSASDDAAGLAISEKMRGQINGLNQASRNAQDGISMIQTAEGGMHEISSMLQRIKELTNQAANDTNTSEDRTKIQYEIHQLYDGIDQMANNLEFNGKKLINGSPLSSDITLQMGANAGQVLKFSIGSVKTNGLGLDKGDIDFATATSAQISDYLKNIDYAIGIVTDERSKLGATQNRMEYTINSLDISAENLTAAESRIRDADMAKEMMNLTKANILAQVATLMLAQANQSTQGILRLLQGI